jgi:hypothetical protein
VEVQVAAQLMAQSSCISICANRTQISQKGLPLIGAIGRQLLVCCECGVYRAVKCRVVNRRFKTLYGK